jgi:hypothetical protein
MAKNNWNQIALTPMSGMLDARSRPAELAPGSFRYKLNLAVNRTGALCTRAGYQALSFGLRSDDPEAVANWDFHRRGTASREPVTFLFESTSPAGVRTLFAGSDTELSRLENDTSEWTPLSPGGSGKRWKAAALGEQIVFVNTGWTGPGSAVLVHTLGTGGFVPIDVASITTAKVVVSFARFILLMNIREGADARTSRVWWSDYELGPNGNGFDFSIVHPDSVAGWQDLDDGDPILNAAEMMGALYIFTARAIWRCVQNSSSDAGTSEFLFQKIYSEPKNQSGCLVYSNSLVSTGRELYWWSHDSIWTFNPYLVAPESPEWLLKGSGAVFSSSNPDRLETRCCESVVGEYQPETKEVWFSYAAASDSSEPNCLNNRSLILNTEFRTMDLFDEGFTWFVNFRRQATDTDDCDAGQVFIGASAVDYCLKQIGGVFHREHVALTGGDVGNDITDNDYSISLAGYFCRLVGLAPLIYPNQEKIVREVLLDHSIKPNSLTRPNLLTLRIGTHFNLVDPMSLEARCAPLWHPQESMPLACPDEATLAAMLANGQRPSDPLAWTVWEIGNRIYFDLKITSAAGLAPVEHDAAFSAMRFDVALA